MKERQDWRAAHRPTVTVTKGRNRGSNLLAPTFPEFAAVSARLYVETSPGKKVHHFLNDVLLVVSVSQLTQEDVCPKVRPLLPLSNYSNNTSGSHLVLINLEDTMLSHRDLTLMKTDSGPWGFRVIMRKATVENSGCYKELL